MNSTRFRAMPRFAVAIIAHLFLFAWFHELSLWAGIEREMWKGFRIGSVAGVALVCAAWVVARGTPEERIAGAVLCLLPGFCLINAVISCWNNL